MCVMLASRLSRRWSVPITASEWLVTDLAGLRTSATTGTAVARSCQKPSKRSCWPGMGCADRITGAKLDARVLQIDHRIPFRVAGDAGLADQDVDAYMLLDASSQRAKSWSCEQCPNFRDLCDP